MEVGATKFHKIIMGVCAPSENSEPFTLCFCRSTYNPKSLLLQHATRKVSNLVCMVLKGTWDPYHRNSKLLNASADHRLSHT
jgi:hypothetical protein